MRQRDNLEIMNANPQLEATTPASSARDFAQRNLQLLRAIDDTLRALGADRAFFDSLGAAVEKFHHQLNDANPSVRIDDGRIVVQFDEGVRIADRIHSTLISKRAAAEGAPELHEDDGVVEAFDECLNAVARFHDALLELRDWIVTHDAILEEPLPASFDSVDALFEAMGVKV